MSRIEGPTVYFVGAASGIGLAAAKELASRGAHLALLDLQPLENAAAEVRAARRTDSQQIITGRIDVTDCAGVERAFADLATDWRAPDIIVSSAGVPGGYAFDAMTPEQFDHVIKVNLYGSYHVARAALPWLERSRGHLMLVASLAGLVGAYGYTSYGASKYGVIGLCEALRIEAKPKGVRVSVFAPPEVETPLVAKERETMPKEGAFLKKNAGRISVSHAGKALAQGIARDRFLVVPGVLANVLLLQLRLLPRSVIAFVTDLQVKLAARMAK